MPNSIEVNTTSTFAKWFRGTFIVVGGIEVFFAILTMFQGVTSVMSQFGIPKEVVDSLHYADAMFWVVLHMCFIGNITVFVGLLVKDDRAQRWLARLFVLFHFVYAYLDVRASDSVLGTGLYQGPASLITPVISCTMFLAILHIAIRSFAKR